MIDPIHIFVDFGNYLFYDYLGFNWVTSIIFALAIYLLIFLSEKLIAHLEKSENKVAKFLTKDLTK